MFALYPDGNSSGSGGGAGGESQWKTNAKFFGKLGLFFVAVRAAHVFMQGKAGGSEGSGSEAK